MNIAHAVLAALREWWQHIVIFGAFGASLYMALRLAFPSDLLAYTTALLLTVVAWAFWMWFFGNIRERILAMARFVGYLHRIGLWDFLAHYGILALGYGLVGGMFAIGTNILVHNEFLAWLAGFLGAGAFWMHAWSSGQLDIPSHAELATAKRVLRNFWDFWGLTLLFLVVAWFGTEPLEMTPLIRTGLLLLAAVAGFAIQTIWTRKIPA